MARAGGNPDLAKFRPKGRKKGCKNKFTTFKAAIEESFKALGGAEYLISTGKVDPASYLAFIKSIIPKQIEQSGPGGEPIKHELNVIEHVRTTNDS